jgi:hypothetical protein
VTLSYIFGYVLSKSFLVSNIEGRNLLIIRKIL